MIYKGVLHMHSEYSYDAKVPLRELKRLLLENGISFACMTEHTNGLTKEAAELFVKECRELSDGEFIFVPGFEVPYALEGALTYHTHILMIGATEYVSEYAENESMLRSWTEQAEVVILAHPIRNKFIVDAALEGVIDGIEIWNQQYDGKIAPRVKSIALLEKLRKNNKLLVATGGLDFHRIEHFGAPVVEVDIHVLIEESVLETLKQKKFTFGNSRYAIQAQGEIHMNVTQVVLSTCTTIFIVLGKFINKILAKLGVSLPKSLKQQIRKKI